MGSNYALYDDLRHRFQDVLDDFTPDVEHYSIDECFVKMPLCYRDLTAAGQEMRQRVRALSGIPVSVGFASTKTLAKLAVEIAKQSDRAGGVVNLVNSPYLTNALERVEVGEAELETFDYIERYYNPIRRHSALGYASPIDFETAYNQKNKNRLKT